MTTSGSSHVNRRRFFTLKDFSSLHQTDYFLNLENRREKNSRIFIFQIRTPELHKPFVSPAYTFPEKSLPAVHRFPLPEKIPALPSLSDSCLYIKYLNYCNSLPSLADMPMDFLSPAALVSPSLGEIPSLPIRSVWYLHTKHPSCCKC